MMFDGISDEKISDNRSEHAQNQFLRITRPPNLPPQKQIPHSATTNTGNGADHDIADQIHFVATSGQCTAHGKDNITEIIHPQDHRGKWLVEIIHNLINPYSKGHANASSSPAGVRGGS
jgi:hypothetical protein